MYQKSDRPYRRKVLAMESVYIRYPGTSVGMAVRIKGKMNGDHFRLGVARLGELYPILNVRIVVDETGQSWFEELEQELAADVVRRESEQTWRDVANTDLHRQFDLWNGPLARFYLVHSDDVSEIVFTGHHSITDGTGIMTFLDVLLRLINNPDEAVEVVREGTLADRKQLKRVKAKFGLSSIGSGFGHLCNKGMYQFVANSWQLTGFRLGQEDEFLLTRQAFNEHYEYVWFDGALTEEETSRMLARCKEKNITVNSLMTTAFLACRNEIDPEHEDNQQTISVDLRRHLDESAQKAVSCYASLLNMKYAYDSTKSFWDNALAYHKRITKKLDNCKDAKKAYLLSMVPTEFLEAMTVSERMQIGPKYYEKDPRFPKMGPKSKHIVALFARGAIKTNAALTMTNLGKAKFVPAYGSCTVEQCFVLTPALINNTIVSAITVNGRIGYVFNVAKPKKEEPEFEDKIRALHQRYGAFLKKDIFSD